MVQKRGLVVVMLVLFVVLLSFNGIGAQSEITLSNDEVLHENALIVFGTEDTCRSESVLQTIQYDYLFGTPRVLEDVSEVHHSSSQQESSDQIIVGLGDWYGPKESECTWTKDLRDDGCYVFADKTDHGDSDQCAGVAVTPGHIISQTPNTLGDDDFISIDDSGSKYMYSGGSSTGSDNSVESAIFNCDLFYTRHSNSYICADKDFSYVDDDGTPVTAPKKVWLKCSAAHVGKYIQIDSMKDELGEYITSYEPGVKTYQCQMRATNEYKWINIGDQTCDSVDCDVVEDVCTNSGAVWNNDLTGNKCCGNNVRDHGSKSLDGDGTEYLCVDTKKVGPDIVDNTEIEDGIECNGDWCLINAKGEQDFNIFTLRTEQSTYDIISNGKEWVQCSVETGLQGSAESEVNRFRCSQQGKYWSWAECTNEEGINTKSIKSESIKVRSAGEGFYTLFPEESDNPISLLKINAQNQMYTQYYGDNYLFDFNGYDFLEFMIQFDNPNDLFFPTDILVNFYGAIDGYVFGPYSALSTVTNNPTLNEDKWFHVKIPLESLTPIEHIDIYSLQTINTFHIKNIYLSKKDSLDSEKAVSLLCSGSVDDPFHNLWLEEIDSDIPGTKITGELICNSLYGGSEDNTEESLLKGPAWFDDENIPPDKRCCGDDNSEYYASKESEYGCWNSEIVQSNEPIMNIEFSGTSTVPHFNVETNPFSFIAVVNLRTDYDYCWDDIAGSDWSYLRANCDFYTKDDTLGVPIDLTSSDDFRVSITGLIEDFMLNLPRDISCLNKQGLDTYFPRIDTICNYSNWLLEQGFISEPLINPDAYLGEVVEMGTTITLQDIVLTVEPNNVVNRLSSSENLNSFGLYDSESQELVGFSMDFSTDNELRSKKDFIQIQAQKSDVFTITPGESQNTPFSKTYTCKSSECVYPIPGSPPYSITNPFPYLYDLYFVYLDEDIGVPREVLITKEDPVFDSPGNIIAKKVPQQVLYGYDGTTHQNKFYGCADHLFTNPIDIQYFDTVDHCAVESGFYCSPSVYDSEAGTVTVNEWIKDSLVYGGYADVILNEDDTVEDVYLSLKELENDGGETGYLPEDFQTVTEDEEGNILSTETTPVTVALPARNIIPNAGFETNDGQVISYWDVFYAYYGGKKKILQNNVFNLPNAGINSDDPHKYLFSPTFETLRSEKIPVPQNTQLYFTYDGINVKARYILIKSDSTYKELENVPSGTNINTENAQFIVIEFVGAGVGFVEKPMLQIIDGELGSVEYYDVDVGKKDELFPTDFRSGVACCPQNFCWNGYACVEPMNDNPYLVELLPDNRTYRCIDGSWKTAKVKTDWYESNWGFCPEDNGCFVYTADVDEEYGQSTDDFYTTGAIPQCIGDTEYVFDHYCEEGDWTTRTKRIASEFLKFVEAKDKYTILCGPYDETLLQYNPQVFLGENAIGQSSEGNIFGGSEVPSSTCFEGINKPNLLSPQENTCVNNICVVRYNDGDTDKVVFATSLNSFEKSAPFLLALGIEPEQLRTSCSGSGTFNRCTFETDVDVWYSKELNAIVYGKESFNLVPSTWNKIVNFFTGLFTNNEFKSLPGFIDEAQNFNHIYALKSDALEIKAVQETIGSQQRMVAEYTGFNSPVCDYIEHLEKPSGTQSSLLHPEKWTCEKEADGTQRFEAVIQSSGTGVFDFFWPQLTARLRVE
ncbi:hypothetical protein COV17_01475 [Candidatus Woesearchaeota archaeon CG10_big_fil_rev_8_21_14_0_10_36_11]|nr:MAG: hypothetical protein COV17_01475 [Candidatus Woesearchaeota archaeon CG10_big_fil_rev_8_21_14_0_10_36_11]